MPKCMSVGTGNGMWSPRKYPEAKLEFQERWGVENKKASVGLNLINIKLVTQPTISRINSRS